MARICFSHVSKRYAGGALAVADLNLTIEDKEFLVLLGPSGCGKSTTLNLIAGLEDISSGELRFDDEIVNDVPPHRRDVAMVFQSYALYPHKTVYENIAFGLRMRRHGKAEIDQRVRAAATRLEITPLLERRPSQLSGGQRQRVALGRAMVREPAVFLMDEPLSNLDTALRISMRAEIKELHRSMATTFVYVTHDQVEALTLADRIVLMRDGIVQQIGTPEAIYERPANMFVASFLGTPPINYLEGHLAAEGDAFWFQRGTLRLDLPARADRLLQHAGRPVRLGLRAEDVVETAEDLPGHSLQGRVTSILPVGSDQYLGITLEGVDCFLRVGKDRRHAEGDIVSFRVEPHRLHVFDDEDGTSLLA